MENENAVVVLLDWQLMGALRCFRKCSSMLISDLLTNNRHFISIRTERARLGWIYDRGDIQADSDDGFYGKGYASYSRFHPALYAN